MLGDFRRRFAEKIQPFLRPALQHRSAPALLVDVLRHKLRIATSPADYFRYEFYKGDRSMAEKGRYLSKRGSRYFPWAKNPVSQLSLFDNKLLFKKMLAGCGIPQSKLLATAGYRLELKTREAFARWLPEARQDLVIKPLFGSGGAGIRMLRYEAGHHYDGGSRVDAGKLWRDLVPGLGVGYVIEERLQNIESVAAFNPHCLNTLRVVSIRTDDDVWRIALVALRIGTIDSAVDNLAAGGTVLKFSPDGVGIAAYDWTQRCEVVTHADSARPLVGYTLDGFASLADFVLRASDAFPEMGAIGWDIALTGDGPKVVEANPYFDSWYFQMGSCGPLLPEEVAAGLTPRRVLSRWDRRYISPRMKRHDIRA